MVMIPVNTSESIRVTAETCIQSGTGQCSHYSDAAVGVS